MEKFEKNQALLGISFLFITIIMKLINGRPILLACHKSLKIDNLYKYLSLICYPVSH